MKMIGMWCVLAVLLCALTAPAAILRVNANGSAQYTTLTAAETAAAAGDTIIVAPGNYPETVSSNKRLTWIGAGYDLVQTAGFYLNDGADRTLIEGFRLEAVYPIYLYPDVDSLVVKRSFLNCTSNYACLQVTRNTPGWLVIEDCILRNGYYGLALGLANDSLVVRNCIFAGAYWYTTSYAFYGNPRFASITNCVFLSYSQLFNFTASQFGLLYANNIVYDWPGAPNLGTLPSGAVLDYNAVAGMVPPGEHGYQLNVNPFASYDPAQDYVFGASDLHLAAGSSLIDAGMPSVIDRNGTRSDLGVYGGPFQFVENGAPDYPFVIQLTVPPAIVGGDSLGISSVGRIGPRY